MLYKNNQSNNKSTQGLKLRNNKQYAWDIYKVAEDSNEWLSRHFDKTYDEMMLILTEGKSREDFDVQICQYLYKSFMVINETNDEVYLLQVFQ